MASQQYAQISKGSISKVGDRDTKEYLQGFAHEFTP